MYGYGVWGNCWLSWHLCLPSLGPPREGGNMPDEPESHHWASMCQSPWMGGSSSSLGTLIRFLNLVCWVQIRESTKCSLCPQKDVWVTVSCQGRGNPLVPGTCFTDYPTTRRQILSKLNLCPCSMVWYCTESLVFIILTESHLLDKSWLHCKNCIWPLQYFYILGPNICLDIGQPLRQHMWRLGEILEPHLLSS